MSQHEPPLEYQSSPYTTYQANTEEELDTTSKRIPLFFPLKDELKGDGTLAPPSGLLEQLKQQLDQGIYTWDEDNFPIPFPDTLPRIGPAIRLQDLFQDPDYQGELLDLAYDKESRELRKLDFMQFEEIRNTGEFSIPSVKFPGQVHVWRLTLLLQKGWKNILATARQELALALTNVLVWIPNRLYRSSFSIPHGVKKIVLGIFWDLPSLLWGLPQRVSEFTEYEVQRRVIKKKHKYLLEELKFGATYNPESSTLAANQVTTLDGIVFDFRLFNKKILEKVRKRLSAIQTEVELTSKKTTLQLQQQISAELKHQGGDERGFAQEIANRIEIAKQQLLELSIRTDSQLEGISPSIYKPIMEMLEANRIVWVAEDELSQRRIRLMTQTIAELQASNPILSMISQWMADKTKPVREKFEEETKYTKLEQCIAMAHERKLELAEYFFRRTLFFEKEREEGIRKVLSSRQVPARVYTFYRRVSLLLVSLISSVFNFLINNRYVFKSRFKKL